MLFIENLVLFNELLKNCCITRRSVPAGVQRRAPMQNANSLKFYLSSRNEHRLHRFMGIQSDFYDKIVREIVLRSENYNVIS